MSATPSFSPRARDKAHPYASPRLQRSSSSASASKNTTTTSSKPHASAAHPMPPSALRTPLLHTDPRTPSPNYFGLAFDSSADVFSSNEARNVRAQWSPPTSQVRSTAAASPRIIPVESNPEFAAFRQQSQNSNFALGRLHTFDASKNIQLPRPNRPTSPVSPNKDVSLPPRPSSAFTTLSSIEIPEKPRSPKRLLSEDEDSVFPDRQRRHSPSSYTGSSSAGSGQDVPFFSPDRTQRPTIPPTKTGSSFLGSHSRAETLPTNIDNERNSDDPTMITPQRMVNLLDSAEEEILLLDLRVSTQYARGRINGALSLCIPTTLIKRPSFNVAKLAETFKDEESRKKFEGWRSSKYIIVYDADSHVLKDATTCLNTLKKFAGEGWNGSSYIVRGGYSEFSSKFPNWVTGSSPADSSSRNSSVSTDSSGPSIAPVIGGCPMPVTENAANPFFGNIRQNMDLIGGVGQMALKRPAALSQQNIAALPSWLTQAIDERDEGKLVSDKFLQIEKREQRRMQEALSANVTYGTPSPGPTTKVKIAGIEKGSKNRYNNIWAYEHSRVKLQGVSTGGCDYVNASHIQSARSNKRYIATQAPIPATFNDFWNVVWQQDVRVIVMLTAESEGGQVKAHNYWSGQSYGHLRLNFLSEHRASLELSRIHRRRDRTEKSDPSSDSPPLSSKSESPTPDQPFVTVRRFTLSHADFPFERMREITQLQYSSWPDFGAPAHPAHLLGLVEQCDAVVRSTHAINKPAAPEPANARPVVVHCSAGCGRTGTFCTVDSVIDVLRRQRDETAQSAPSQHQTPTKKRYSLAEPMDLDPASSQAGTSESFFSAALSSTRVSTIPRAGKDEAQRDLIEDTVEEFRYQRLSMVQSLRQFVLCYETVLEWISAGAI